MKETSSEETISVKVSAEIKESKTQTSKTQTTSTSMNPLEQMISDIAVNAVSQRIDELGIKAQVKEIRIVTPEQQIIEAGVQHCQFEEIMLTLAAKVPVCLVGPAGSGKTTVVKEAAKALGLSFFSKSVTAQTGVHEFFGYMNANGDYVQTLFRDAYENGGIFLLDEFDAGNPNVLAALNQAIANGECAFADKMVDIHPDFNIVMAGNTYGHGATAEYVGRNKIDAATLDRFAFITFNYDESLEMALCSNKKWCEIVQKTRELAASKKIRTIISPRATFYGERMLAAGLSLDKVMNMLIYKGMTSDEVKMLS